MLVTNTAFFSWNSVLFINKIPIHVRNLVFILIDVLIQAKKGERVRRNKLQRSEYKEQTSSLFKILNKNNGNNDRFEFSLDISSFVKLAKYFFDVYSFRHG